MKATNKKNKLELTEAFTLIGGPVDEDLRADDVPEGQEHLHQLRVTELLR